MKPAPIVLWPFPDEIARVVVAAALAEGEDPIAVATGRARSRARIYAFIALAHRFPTVPRRELMIKVGHAPVSAYAAYIAAIQITRGDNGKDAKWWRLGMLNRIVAAIGWPPMSTEDAQVRLAARPTDPKAIERRAKKAEALADREVIEPIPATIARHERIEKRNAGASIDPTEPTNETARDVAVVAEVAPQPEPRTEPICQPETPKRQLERLDRQHGAVVAKADHVIKRARGSSSPSSTALAVNGRPGPSTALTIKKFTPPAVPRNSYTGALDISYRPDPPVHERDVEIWTPALMGDPAPQRSALWERQQQLSQKPEEPDDYVYPRD